MKRVIIFIILFFTSIAAFAAEPLSVDQAFHFSATAKNYQTILLTWKIAPDYYLYQKDFKVDVIKPDNMQLGQPLFPSNTQSLKTALGVLSVYAGTVTLPVPILNATEKSMVVQVHYQGCSKAGYCYPPMSKIVLINLTGDFMRPAQIIHIDIAPKTFAHEQNKFEKIFHEKSLLMVIISFLGFGVLLSLTPCVLPMIPILSSMIVGKEKKHAFLLSVLYVFGMAMTYAIVGIIFSFIGSNIQSVFQKPWIIIAFSVLFFIMALSLFGLFNLQLPESWRAKIAAINYSQNSGSYISAIIMGIVSTLVLSPCVTPPLVAALGWISQSDDIVQGGVALFFLGIGMGVPLLLIGAFGSHILPKSGRWMNGVKYFIGILLLLLSMTMLFRLAPTNNDANSLHFQSVKTIEDVDAKLTEAQKKHEPVMLDFYANWCVSCKELDLTTFRNIEVQKQLQHFMLLRADVTENSMDDKMLMQQYHVVAPPTMLFFVDGHEVANSRMFGYQPAEPFLKKLSVILMQKTSKSENTVTNHNE